MTDDYLWCSSARVGAGEFRPLQNKNAREVPGVLVFLCRSGQCTPCIHLRIFGVMSSSRAAAPRPVAVGIM